VSTRWNPEIVLRFGKYPGVILRPGKHIFTSNHSIRHCAVVSLLPLYARAFLTMRQSARSEENQKQLPAKRTINGCIAADPRK
jgi:hypothetical protein